MFDIIAFDADDTLWHNEVLYSTALDGLKALLAPYASPSRSLTRFTKQRCATWPITGMASKAMPFR